MSNKMLVEGSKTIKSLEYFEKKQKLVVEFLSGVQYKYRNVPKEQADELFNAESKGKYFAKHIKDRFVTEKIGAVLVKPGIAPISGENPWPFPTGEKP
jgi:accessory colonization factor AcfC